MCAKAWVWERIFKYSWQWNTANQSMHSALLATQCPEECLLGIELFTTQLTWDFLISALAWVTCDPHCRHHGHYQHWKQNAKQTVCTSSIQSDDEVDDNDDDDYRNDYSYKVLDTGWEENICSRAGNQHKASCFDPGICLWAIKCLKHCPTQVTS